MLNWSLRFCDEGKLLAKVNLKGIILSSKTRENLVGKVARATRGLEFDSIWLYSLLLTAERS